ncbi:transcription antitermination factor NusB [Candidatus Woesebacteria bacterium]|nr:transcription antitermination factor NusB [Candidatus Woesebacteria bacterium]
MKVKRDPRHEKRKKIVQDLFAASLNKTQQLTGKTKKVWEKRGKIDPLIKQTAPEWPLENLNKSDLAILRLAVFELSLERKEPVKVVIDEAIELAKELGSESSPSFVNGVLGTIVKDQRLEKE